MQASDAYRWFFDGVWLTYAIACVAALRLKDWKVGRYVPLASALVVWPLPYVFSLFGFGHFVERFAPIGLLGGPVLMFVTLILAWSGRRFTERVLRVTSSVILAWIVYFLFRGHGCG